MKFTMATLLALVATAVTATPTLETRASKPKGIDVSHYQGTVNFNAAKADGVVFTFIKATEGHSTSFRLPSTTEACSPLHFLTAYKDASFSANYEGATKAGILRGGYHFAHPDSSSGAVQAKFFLAHGGGWSKDGRTLPGALDIECGSPSTLHRSSVRLSTRH